MADLVVIAFPNEAKAEEVRQKLLAMQKEYLIELGDAVIAVKDADIVLVVAMRGGPRTISIGIAAVISRMCARPAYGTANLLTN
jgi:uncharacterized membrane protein